MDAVAAYHDKVAGVAEVLPVGDVRVCVQQCGLPLFSDDLAGRSRRLGDGDRLPTALLPPLLHVGPFWHQFLNGTGIDWFHVGV